MVLVGQRAVRTDGFEKVTGEALYVADLRMAGLLTGKVLRSPLPHARIRHIDTTRAARVPGVRAVITADDTPKLGWGPFLQDQWPLAIDKVRFVGEEVAAVAATDEDAALEALDLIDVDYEELPAVFDPEAAMLDGAPLIHDDHPRNVAVQFRVERGDVEGGFRKSAVVVEDTFQTTMQFHAYIEPIGSIAQWEAGGKLTVWMNAWSAFMSRECLAQALGLRLGDIRVIQPWVGGSFGGKVCDDNNAMVCALLAKKARRPVRIVNTREEEYLASRPRVPARLRLRLGFHADGTIAAKDIRVVMDNGASSGKSPAVLGVTCQRSDHLYRYRNVRSEGYLVYTNKIPTGSMRGFGNPKSHFAVESLIDMAAAELHLDPAEVRQRNAAQRGDTSVHGAHFLSCGLGESIRKVTEMSGWAEKRRTLAGTYRGIGMACMVHVSGKRHFEDWDGSSLVIKVSDDGKVTILCGEGETGSGAATVLSQIAADELGVPLADVEMSQADTENTPFAHGTHASRVTYIGGNAVKLAARAAREQLFEAAARTLEVATEDLEVQDGRIRVRGTPERGLTVAEAARAQLYRPGGQPVIGVGTWDPPSQVSDPQTKYGNESGAYTFGSEVAEIEIDPDTGQVTVKAFWAAIDCGTVVNPMLAEGQVEGALQQGIGFTLSEQILYQDGQPLNPNFGDYKIPTASEMPRLEIAWVQDNEPTGPFGAKGLGEPVMVPVAPAIANAIYHATGVRLTQLPFTAEKVLAALRARENTGG
jgi:4-hydroxybenzoyl-CoA reductase alpha subunit